MNFSRTRVHYPNTPMRSYPACYPDLLTNKEKNGRGVLETMEMWFETFPGHLSHSFTVYSCWTFVFIADCTSSSTIINNKQMNKRFSSKRLSNHTKRYRCSVPGCRLQLLSLVFSPFTRTSFYFLSFLLYCKTVDTIEVGQTSAVLRFIVPILTPNDGNTHLDQKKSKWLYFLTAMS